MENAVGKTIEAAARLVERYNNMATCCRDVANLELRDEGVVKCAVCGARNLLGDRVLPEKPPSVIKSGTPKECCETADNLVESLLRDDLTVHVCKVCGCRHFEMQVDPGSLGLRGAAFG